MPTLPPSSAQQQDFTPVVFRKRPTTHKPAHPTAATASKRHLGGTNKSATYKGAANMRKLDDSTSGQKRNTVSRAFAKAVQQKRTSLKLSQVELAQRIHEKPTVVNAYESGKAIVNPVIVQKLHKALGGGLPSARQK